jgi:crotonobetainyl-CoA:carnitine CoA-transferase CaiB-like acyl-CoA transferase
VRIAHNPARNNGKLPLRLGCVTGGDNVAASMLDGIRVIEMANVISGPFTGMQLADMGAEVIKVETPGTGDPFRDWASDTGEISPAFAAYNRGKLSIEIDIKTPEGRATYLELAASADVVIENFRPGALDRAGVGYDALKEIAPHLVYCSITGMGQVGPDHQLPTYDGIAQAASGLLSQLVDLTAPDPVGPPISDQLTGLYAALGILGALLARRETGQGRRIDVSMLGATLAFQPHAAAEYLMQGLVADKTSRARVSQSFGFVCRDGRALAVHLSSPPKFWLALLAALGREDLAAHPHYATKAARERNYIALRGELAIVFVRRARAEWLEVLRASDVPCGPVNTIAEALRAPQAQALGLTRTFGDGARAVPLVGYPFDDNLRPQTDHARPVPKLGEHTADIIAGLATRGPRRATTT